MAEYVCSICGFIYNEAKGIPESGIKQATSWIELPEDWVCPVCLATKEAFNKIGQSSSKAEDRPVTVIETSADTEELSPLEVSALCTNLGLGLEKQYKDKEAILFRELGDYFKLATKPVNEPNLKDVMKLIESDLQGGFSNVNAVARDKNDRGALRALTWTEKVTKMLHSILVRYEREGDSMLDNTEVHVCTICGFVYIGDRLPDVCPVCKVPNWKFDIVEGRK